MDSGKCVILFCGACKACVYVTLYVCPFGMCGSPFYGYCVSVWSSKENMVLRFCSAYDWL